MHSAIAICLIIQVGKYTHTQNSKFTLEYTHNLYTDELHCEVLTFFQHIYYKLLILGC